MKIVLHVYIYSAKSHKLLVYWGKYGYFTIHTNTGIMHCFHNVWYIYIGHTILCELLPVMQETYLTLQLHMDEFDS